MSGWAPHRQEERTVPRYPDRWPLVSVVGGDGLSCMQFLPMCLCLRDHGRLCYVGQPSQWLLVREE